MISTKAQDAVALLDDNLNQVAANARIISAQITEESQVMSHPVETGGTIEDEIVFSPTTISLNIILAANSYRSTYQEIKQLYTRRALLTVQTKADSYQSLVIENMPHDEDASLFDTLAISIRLKEVKFVETEYEAYTPTTVRNPADASNKRMGEASKREASTQELESVLGKGGAVVGRTIGL